MLLINAASMEDACVTVTSTTFDYSWRCICGYPSDHPVRLPPLQSTPYQVPKFNLLGNTRRRPIVIKVHTGSQITVFKSPYKDSSTTTSGYPSSSLANTHEYRNPWSYLPGVTAFTISGDSGPFTFDSFTVTKSSNMQQRPECVQGICGWGDRYDSWPSRHADHPKRRVHVRQQAEVHSACLQLQRVWLPVPA